MRFRVAFLVGQLVQGVALGALLAVALGRLLSLTTNVPVFRYLMF